MMEVEVINAAYIKGLLGEKVRNAYIYADKAHEWRTKERMMPDHKRLLLEIDGVLIEFTDMYPIEDCLFGMQLGVAFGFNEDTSGESPICGLNVFDQEKGGVGVVNVYRDHLDGSRWGIHGLFRNAEWAPGEDVVPLFRVSDRLA